MNLLILEDVDEKYTAVSELICAALGSDVQITRAKSIVEAQDFIEAGGWDLVIVDISMDIAQNAGDKTREAHANLGGMDIIEQMFLLEKDAPTIIVTGFDYFVASGRDVDEPIAQTFTDLGVKAKAWLGTNYLGSVRYGKPNWDTHFSQLLGRWKDENTSRP